MANPIIRPLFSRLSTGALAAAALAAALATVGCGSSHPADAQATTAQAQPGSPGPGGAPGARAGGRRLGQVLQSLGLSDDQKEQIRKIMQDARTQARAETDPDKRRTILRGAFAKVQDVLTPAQRDAFKAKMQALRNSSGAAGGAGNANAGQGAQQ